MASRQKLKHMAGKKYSLVAARKQGEIEEAKEKIPLKGISPGNCFPYPLNSPLDSQLIGGSFIDEVHAQVLIT